MAEEGDSSAGQADGSGWSLGQARPSGRGDVAGVLMLRVRMSSRMRRYIFHTSRPRGSTVQDGAFFKPCAVRPVSLLRLREKMGKFSCYGKFQMRRLAKRVCNSLRAPQSVYVERSVQRPKVV